MPTYCCIAPAGLLGAGKKAAIAKDITRVHSEVTGAAGFFAHLWAYVVEIPPRQMIEYGHVLPEPGDEPDWIASLPKDDRHYMQSLGK
ncbi:MAG: hypothetical protein HY242_12485 [Afipia sp.]|nr:hypothetical protein [Afipia sp.]